MRTRLFAGSGLTVLLLAAAILNVVWMQPVPDDSWRPCINFGADSNEPPEFPNCILRSKTGRLSVAPGFLKRLSFGDFDLATLASSQDGWMYVNRKGAVVVSGVAVFDNGADPFQHGLVRFRRGGKWGLADYTGRVLVPAVFDGAANSADDRPMVCKGCVEKCADDADCEHHYFSGGDWLSLDDRGKLVEHASR